MKIITLVENNKGTNCDLINSHGLSFYIETKDHKVLFDVGDNNTIIENAKKLKINLTKIDTIIISHGHKDHCGALSEVLKINKNAKVYIQAAALNKMVSINSDDSPNVINMDYEVLNNYLDRIVFLDGDLTTKDFIIFKLEDNILSNSNANNSLYYLNEDKEYKLDKFAHEQNLIIENVLFTGCSHKGITNIIKRGLEINSNIKYIFGGFHTYNPRTNEVNPNNQLDELIENLKLYNDTNIFTCHCTGSVASKYITSKLLNVKTISVGTTIITE